MSPKSKSPRTLSLVNYEAPTPVQVSPEASARVAELVDRARAKVQQLEKPDEQQQRYDQQKMLPANRVEALLSISPESTVYSPSLLLSPSVGSMTAVRRERPLDSPVLRAISGGSTVVDSSSRAEAEELPSQGLWDWLNKTSRNRPECI